MSGHSRHPKAKRLASQAVVIFGASGDLTRRKLLPAFFHLFLEGMLPEGFAIVGYSLDEWNDDEFREHARESLAEFGKHDPSGEVWNDFSKHLSYLAGNFSDAAVFNELSSHLDHVDQHH